MPSQCHITSAGFWLALAAVAFIGGCSEQATPPVKQEVVQLTAEQRFAATLKKALAGDASSQVSLGFMYAIGDDVPRDMAKAVEWWQKAAAQGDADAQHSLGLAYSNGEGVPKDMAKAVEWWRKAVAQGHARAQFDLGLMYLHGAGVPEDMAKAVEWWQKAADQSFAPAQTSLGLAYRYGEGVPKDVVKAVELFRKAANQGESKAQLELGSMYAKGEGVPKDDSKSTEWYQKSAAQGNSAAQFGLAFKYSSLQQRDYVLAYAWFNLAAMSNEANAAKFREIIGRELSTAELLEAQRLSSGWKKGQILVREGKKGTANASSASGNPTKNGTGTAFLVSKTGQAITNHHVIDGCREVRAEGRDGVVKVVTSDTVNDLVLLQIPGTINATAPITSEPAKLRQGEDIVAFGFPLNSVLSSGGNLTPGVVSALTGLGNNTNQIQITAPIQPGSSGSPVINKKGEVVGVVSMKLSDSKMAKATGQIGQNVNFAVNGQTLKSFLDAHKVEYRNGNSFFSREKSAADLADEARKWSLVVECWK